MFWSKKKEAPAEKKPLLYRENIKTGCTVSGKDEAIRMVGQMLVDSGYVDQPYVEAMLEREKTFPTYMGNGLALPHGVEAAKKEVKVSGIAVITLKNPIDWEGNEAQVIIGIAGVGDEHLEILGIIADKMMDEAAKIAKIMAKQRSVSRMSAQAVGGAVGHNPISIIVPCHRVVGTNGNLTGYAGGIDKKISLLKIEKTDVKKLIQKSPKRIN